MPDETREPLAAVGETQHRAFAAEVTTDGTRSTFVIMTSDVARDGMIVEADGFDVAAYRANPVVLWQHGWDARQGFEPIGQGLNLRMEGGRWLADVEWDDDEFAQRIAGKVKRGTLSAVSIGWRTLDAGWETRDGAEVYVIRRAELTEFSVVAVPADPGALAVQRADALPLASEIAGLRDEIAELRAERAAPVVVPEVEIVIEPKSIARAVAETPEAPTPEAAPRAATPDEIAAVAVKIADQVHQSIQRALGRA